MLILDYNPHELKLMSSDGTYSTIADFSKVDEIMQDLMFKTCTDYDCSKLFEDMILQNFWVAWLVYLACQS